MPREEKRNSKETVDRIINNSNEKLLANSDENTESENSFHQDLKKLFESKFNRNIKSDPGVHGKKENTNNTYSNEIIDNSFTNLRTLDDKNEIKSDRIIDYRQICNDEKKYKQIISDDVHKSDRNSGMTKKSKIYHHNKGQDKVDEKYFYVENKKTNRKNDCFYGDINESNKNVDTLPEREDNSYDTEYSQISEIGIPHLSPNNPICKHFANVIVRDPVAKRQKVITDFNRNNFNITQLRPDTEKQPIEQPYLMYTNRYHYNHLEVRKDTGGCPNQEDAGNIYIEKKSDSKLGKFRKFVDKMTRNGELKNCNHHNYYRSSHDLSSGETIPQLYMAQMKKRFDSIPEIIKFKAINNEKDFLKDSEEAEHTNMIIDTDKHVKFERTGHPNHKNDENRELDKIKLSNRNVNIEQPDCNRLTHLTDPLIYAPLEIMDIYCFDHQNSGYFRTTDHAPAAYTDYIVHKADQYSTKLWAEIFGFFHIIITIITSFILQFIKFFLYSTFRPIIIGTIQMISDYFLKPMLMICFNGIFQPIIIFFYNIALSFRDLCQPIAKGIGFFIRELATILRAIRLVEVKKNNGPFLTHPKYNI